MLKQGWKCVHLARLVECASEDSIGNLCDFGKRWNWEGGPQFSFVFGSAIPNRSYCPIQSPILQLVEDEATF